MVHRLDPRVRLVVAGAFSLVIALSAGFHVLTFGMTLAIALVLCGRLRLGGVLKRLVPLNIFMAVLAALLPLGTPGVALFHIGPLAYSREGVIAACGITLKGNAIALALTGLVATMDPVTLGHALHRLHVPLKLVHLFLFTVRYLAVLEREYNQLVRAMRVRCFRPGPNRHTVRSIGYLVAVLLVRAFDRSERILAAMKCRGFTGRFPMLEEFRLGYRDVIFSVTSAAVLFAMVLGEWLCMTP